MDRRLVTHCDVQRQAPGIRRRAEGTRVVTSSINLGGNGSALSVGLRAEWGVVAMLGWCAPSPGPAPAHSPCSTPPAARCAAELVMARARWSCGPRARRRARARGVDVHAAASPAHTVAATPPRRAPQCLSCRRPLSCRQLCRSSPHARPLAPPPPTRTGWAPSARYRRWPWPPYWSSRRLRLEARPPSLCTRLPLCAEGLAVCSPSVAVRLREAPPRVKCTNCGLQIP